MAKAPSPSRSQATKDSTKCFSKTDGPGIASRRTTRHATAGPDTGSQPASRVVKAHPTQTSSPSATKMSPKPQGKKDVRQTCELLLETADAEIQRLNEENDKQGPNTPRLVQQLRAEKAHDAVQLRKSMAEKEHAVATSQESEREVFHLKQQLEPKCTA